MTAIDAGKQSSSFCYNVYRMDHISPVVRGHHNFTVAFFVPINVGMSIHLDKAKELCNSLNKNNEDATIQAFVRKIPQDQEFEEDRCEIVYPDMCKRSNTFDRCVGCNRFATSRWADKKSPMRCHLRTCDVCSRSCCNHCEAPISLTQADVDRLKDEGSLTKKEIKQIETACPWCANYRPTSEDEDYYMRCEDSDGENTDEEDEDEEDEDEEDEDEEDEDEEKHNAE